MANDGQDIDLYADDLEFNQDATEFNDQNVDLYDDVITQSRQGKNSSSANNSHHDNEYGPNNREHSGNAPNSNEFHSHHHHHQHHSTNEIQSNPSSNSSSGKKIGIYVGNLTWWTTDQDIVHAINGLGITDIIEVKFFENRANGQSKGFCVVSLGSESSVKNVIDKLPKSEIHSQHPVVTPCNKQNLNHFEMQSRKNNPGHANNMNNGNMGNMNMNNGPNHMRPPFGNNPMGMPNNGGGHNMRPPLINRPQRPNGPPLLSNQPGGPRIPMNQGPGPGYGHGNNQGGMQNNMWNQNMGGPQPGNRGVRGGNGPMHGSPQGPGGSRMPMNQPGPMGMQRMPMQNAGGGISRNSSQPLLRAPGPMSDRQDWDHGNVHGSVMPGPMGQQNPMDMHGPAPHVNPAFFGPGQQQDPYSRSSNPSSSYSNNPNDYGRMNPMGSQSSNQDSSMVQLSESEFEDLMGKNRHVSSNAITRAVSDASVGDFTSAIETLVTAISLIKQSKVSGDERCKILISALQDTLHGIESKSYSARKDRPRSREKMSRERSSRREKSRRDRSRSRSPADRYRSREKDERRYRRSRSRDRRSRDKYKG